MKIVLILLCGVAFLASFPVGLIWSLNVLFGLAIPLTLKTWAAGFFVTVLFLGRVSA